MQTFYEGMINEFIADAALRVGGPGKSYYGGPSQVPNHLASQYHTATTPAQAYTPYSTYTSHTVRI